MSSEVVDAEHQQQAGFRQAEHGQHGGSDDQRGAWHPGNALLDDTIGTSSMVTWAVSVIRMS